MHESAEPGGDAEVEHHLALGEHHERDGEPRDTMARSGEAGADRDAEETADDRRAALEPLGDATGAATGNDLFQRCWSRLPLSVPLAAAPVVGTVMAIDGLHALALPATFLAFSRTA